MQISPNDKKTYDFFTLPNRLRVLLVHDDDTNHSAAALSVTAGHFDDPMDRQGMAHFLEHMLFLGTETHPELGEFQHFIDQHGGSQNAWTGTENTTYFFDILTPAFEAAIERFSAFFTCPLLCADAVEKERQAIDSEYKLKLFDDVRRIYQVHKETVNPEHPFSKFSVGDHTTLEDRPNQAVRDDLLAFHQTHYVAHRMALVIVSSESLETQKTWVENYFSNVPDNQYDPAELPPLLKDEQKQKWIAIEPLKEIRKLTLSFSLPSTDPYYTTKPLSYLAHLLGNEGTGSVLAYLKAQGLAQSLSAGGGIMGQNFREFTISLTLTHKGMNHIDEIIQTIFQYLALIQEEGINEWRYLEKRSVLNLAYRYQEATRPLDLANHLVLNVLQYQAEHIVNGDYLMENWDEGLIRHFLDRLTPDNLRVLLVAKDQEYNRNAQWYDTPYSVKPLTENQLSQWCHARANSKHDALSLPLSNPYLSDRLEPHALTESALLPPQCIMDEEGFRLWFQQEAEFQVPKGVIYVAIDSPHAVSSVKNIVKTHVCVEMLLEAVNEMAYPAEIAGISYQLYTHQGGVTLKVSGFTDKQPQLLSFILSSFQSRTFDSQRFDHVKTLLMKQWRNAANNKPLTRLFNELTGILQPNNPPYRALFAELETLQRDELPSFVMAMLSELHLDVFIYGDWQLDQARYIGKQLKNTFRVTDQRYGESQRPLVHLENSKTLRYELPNTHDDSALLMYYQSPEATPDAVALYSFANHLMSNTFFHELRTKQQLGYMVGTANLPLNRHPGLILYAQSPTAAPKDLTKAMDRFTNDFSLVLLGLTQKDWENSKSGLLNKMSEPDPHLHARAQRLWVCIGNKDSQFIQRQQVINALTALKREDMIRFVVNVLKPRSANRLIVYCQGQAHQSHEPLTLGQPINSIDEFMKNAK